MDLFTPLRFVRTAVLAAAVVALPLGGSAQGPAAAAQAVKAAAVPDPWWKHAFLYEVYPRSFADSDGDGVGDLNGIAAHLDYLQTLGVDALWIAPIYPSPQVDFGYDIADYENVDPQYGTLNSFDRLLAEAKKRNLRIVMDMVLNHTSDKSKWFTESASSRTNPKADWYVWSDGLPASTPGLSAVQKRFAHDGMLPPNNWQSLFGGSAWEWVPARRQFYYHKFYVQQPDLNWRNPQVEARCFDAMRFWLDRGVAGFRLDAVTTLFEDPQARDEPLLGGTNAQGDPVQSDVYTANLPEVHTVMRRMRAMTDTYPGDRVLIGETYLPSTAELNKWYGGEAKDELQLPMDLLIGFNSNTDYGAAHFRKYLAEVQTEVHGSQPLIVFDNHDNVRSIDRYGDGTHNIGIAKTVAAMLFTTRGTALSYYGAELGMTTAPPARKEDVKDPVGITGWPADKGRDGERTPMQWTPGPQAGFSTNPKTWLPVTSNYKTVNVVTESADRGSLLNWTKGLVALRRSNAAVRDGAMTMLNPDDANVLSYLRANPAGGEPVAVAINMSAQPRTVDLRAGGRFKSGTVLLASEPGMATVRDIAAVTLPPFATVILAVR